MKSIHRVLGLKSRQAYILKAVLHGDTALLAMS
jgi:hypothetical protein